MIDDLWWDWDLCDFCGALCPPGSACYSLGEASECAELLFLTEMLKDGHRARAS